MTWTASFEVQTADGLEEITATSPSEIDGALARLLKADYVHIPTVHIVERPTFGPAEMPDHGLKIDFCVPRQLGALAYFGEVPEDPEGWAYMSLATEPVTDPPELYRDLGGPVAFPANAVIPFDAVERAVIRFWELGGQRPDSVAWQPAESW
ncbi:Imm1 family immunity protein [Crossiella sp. CA198]|uniref:Imm1 family immunity protein n=1 Tax=Crossiella sp. CA198 TaxID=3455607 RepID=UPI003F8D2109